MIEIVRISKNPKRKTKKKARGKKKAKVTLVIKNPKRSKSIHKPRVKIIPVKRNPTHPMRKKYQTMIVGLVRGMSGQRYKRMYFTGKGFSNSAEDAKIYPGSVGKLEAKRILPMLPNRVARIYVERV
jgi:hypothetical protein